MGISFKPGSVGSVLQALRSGFTLNAGAAIQWSDAWSSSISAASSYVYISPHIATGQLISSAGVSCSIGSGSNAFTINTAGARLKLSGGGTTDYLVSDGSSTISTPGTFTATTGLNSTGFSVSSGNVNCAQITNGGLIVSSSGVLQELTGQVADGAGSIAVAISPFAAYSNATSKIVSFRNQRAGTEKIAIDSRGKLIYPTGTADAVAGNATLVGGTVTVNTISVTANSVILLTRKAVGGSTGDLRVGTITAGTSFVINSASGTDTSTVSWLIIN